jgi:predicted Zn-dependent protease
MMHLQSKFTQKYKNGLTALLCVAAISGCVSTNPATGKQHLSFVSEEGEYELGHKVYGQIVKERGGIYKESKKLTQYMNTRLAEVVKISERADKPFKMTILDDESFNAAAIPGYIFFHRGVFPFLHNEAQMMAILGHEVGHVTARHTARQQTTATIANITMAVIDAYVTYNGSGSGLQQVNQISGVAAQYLFAGYSRGHEEEADELAIRYLDRLKYNPMAASGSFDVMGKYYQWVENIHDKAGKKIQSSIFHRLLSTHPETNDRVQATLQEAANKYPKRHLVHRDRYLDAIDGIAFGPAIKEHGVAKKNTFIHPNHRFSFHIPEGYIVPMMDTLPMAFHKSKARTINYSYKAVPIDEDAEESLIYNYKNIQNVKPITLGGIEGYTGIIKTNDHPIDAQNPYSRKVDIITRVVGFKGKHDLVGEKVYGKRGFYSIELTSSVQNFPESDKEFMKIVQSVKLLTKAEADAVEPLRVHIYTTKKGDTQKSIAEKMGFSTDRLEWFHRINDIHPNDKILPGMRLKLIY